MSPISPSSPMAGDSTSVLALWATAYGILSRSTGRHPERYPERGMPESWATAAGIALDHTADVPLGVQLDWVVRAAVASGRLHAGDRLPGLREVADQLGVNHNTVRAAVAKLEADGLLETRHGSGTFVAAGAATQLRQAALLDEVAQRAQDAGVTPRELAAALYVAEPAAASRARPGCRRASHAAPGPRGPGPHPVRARAAARRGAGARRGVCSQRRPAPARRRRAAGPARDAAASRRPGSAGARPARRGDGRSGRRARPRRRATPRVARPRARRGPVRRPPRRSRYTSGHADRPWRARVRRLGARPGLPRPARGDRQRRAASPAGASRRTSWPSGSASAARRCARRWCALRDERLVAIVPQLGTFVTLISNDGVEDAAFVREALECAAIRLATERARPEDLAELQANLAAQDRAQEAGDADAFDRLDDALHRRLCELSGREIAWHLSRRANGHLDRVRRLSLPEPGYLGEMVAEHRQVVAAVADRDPDHAEATLRHHLRMVLSSLPHIREVHPDYFEESE